MYACFLPLQTLKQNKPVIEPRLNRYQIKMKRPSETLSSPRTPNREQQKVDVDFSEYAWMGEELEEFDRKV